MDSISSESVVASASSVKYSEETLTAGKKSSISRNGDAQKAPGNINVDIVNLIKESKGVDALLSMLDERKSELQVVGKPVILKCLTYLTQVAEGYQKDFLRKLSIRFVDASSVSYKSHIISVLDELLEKCEQSSIVLDAVASVLHVCCSKKRKVSDLGTSISYINQMDAKAKSFLPKNYGNLPARVADLNHLDVTNVFKASEALDACAEEGSCLLQAISSGGSQFATSEHREQVKRDEEDLKRQEQKELEVQRKAIEKMKSDNDQSKVFVRLNELEKEKSLLLLEKDALLTKLASIEASIKSKDKESERLKALTISSKYVESATLTHKRNDLSRRRQELQAMEKVEKQIVSILPPVIDVAGADKDDLASSYLAAMDKYFIVKAFCRRYLERKTAALVAKVAALGKLMHGKSDSHVALLDEQRITFQEELATSRQSIADLSEKTAVQAMHFGEFVLTEVGRRGVDQVKSDNTFLLPIWRIRDNCKALGILEYLQVEKFSELMPENIGKSKVKPKKQAQKKAAKAPKVEPQNVPAEPQKVEVKKPKKEKPKKVKVKSTARGWGAKPSQNTVSLQDIQSEQQ